MTLNQHLSHLMWLMAEPFTEAFKAHCWHRAKELARDPELADLPRMLTQAVTALENSRPTPSAQSRTKPETLPETTESR